MIHTIEMYFSIELLSMNDMLIIVDHKCVEFSARLIIWVFSLNPVLVNTHQCIVWKRSVSTNLKSVYLNTYHAYIIIHCNIVCGRKAYISYMQTCTALESWTSSNLTQKKWLPTIRMKAVVGWCSWWQWLFFAVGGGIYSGFFSCLLSGRFL